MLATVGQPVEATIIDPGSGSIPAGLHLGARIEVPVTRAIASNFMLATLSGSAYTVTLDGVTAAGDYNFVWMTDDPDPPVFEAFVPLVAVAGSDVDAFAADFPPVDAVAVRPTVEDVADLEMTRTVTDGGDIVYEFTADTSPSDVQCDRLIDTAVPIVLAELRPAFSTGYYEQVRHAIALYTAMLVEGSFFREQISQGSVGLWQHLYDNTMIGIKESIEQDLAHLVLEQRLEPTPLPPPQRYQPSAMYGA